MKAIDSLSSWPALNLLILGLFIVAIVWIVLSKVKSFKAGKIEATVRDSHTDENRRMVVETMNFSFCLSQELVDGEWFYKKAVRRKIRENIERYAIALKSKYRKFLHENRNEDYQLTYADFCSILDGAFSTNTLRLLMDVYENNHITNLTKAELDEKADGLYWQVVCIFKKFFQETWLDEMCPYEDLQKICQGFQNEAMEIMRDNLEVIQTNLKQLFALRQAVQNIRDRTSIWIVEKGLLPPEAMGLVDSFVEPNKGLNASRVEDYLNLIQIKGKGE